MLEKIISRISHHQRRLIVTSLGLVLIGSGLLFAHPGQPRPSLSSSKPTTPQTTETLTQTPIPTPPQSPTPVVTSQSLPPCPSTTATGCDKSKINPAGSGSANCDKKGVMTITASPIAQADLLYIQPMGLMIGGHVTPIDHGYFYVKSAQTKPPTKTPVYAPLDGLISTMHREHRGGDTGAKADAPKDIGYDDYSLTIEGSCTFRVRFSNLTAFGGPIGEQLGEFTAGQTATPNYHVKAGEQIGYTAGDGVIQGIDVWVENDATTLTGFVKPEQYIAGESWKVHMVDLFDYTAEPLRSQLLEFLERDAQPYWGKIDYDQDGKLIGNWFKVGTGGYVGLQQSQEGYWAGHLSIVPDGNDPSWTDVSFGSYQGAAQQFAVVDNTINPALISAESGLVKFEIGQIETYSGDTGELWNGQRYLPHIRTKAGPAVGTVLMQVVDQRSLRVEVFPHKQATQITGFDTSAELFER